jgi:hypothetical protein
MTGEEWEWNLVGNGSESAKRIRGYDMRFDSENCEHGVLVHSCMN